MTVDPSTLAPAALAGELVVIADYLTGVGLDFYAAELREAARRIAPATAALAAVPPRLELVVDGAPNLGAACVCLCHRLEDGLGYSHRTKSLTGDDVAACCSEPGRPYNSVERAAALLAAADKLFA